MALMTHNEGDDMMQLLPGEQIGVMIRETRPGDILDQVVMQVYAEQDGMLVCGYECEKTTYCPEGRYVRLFKPEELCILYTVQSRSR
jgi:hypothetical protein